MDTITHGIAGALIGKAFFTKREGRIATFAVTAGAVFPDSDTLVTLFSRDRLAFLEIHRGITHSVLMLPIFALLFGWLTSLLIRRKEKWRLLSVLYGIGISSHILFDLITSYGTMIWSPVSNVRVTWDMVFIVDVIFTSIALLPQLIAWVYSDRKRVRGRALAVWICSVAAGAVISLLVRQVQVNISAWMVAVALVLIAVLLWVPSWGGRGFLWHESVYCRVGVGMMAIYLGLCAIAHRAALARVEDFVRSAGVSAERIAALPAPPSLLQWSGLVETPNGVYRGAIHLGERVAPDIAASQLSYTFFPNAQDNPYVQKAESLPEVKRYLWFARFPWVTSHWENDLHVVEIKDAQFFWPPRRGNAPFTFRVSMDRKGTVLHSGLLTP